MKVVKCPKTNPVYSYYLLQYQNYPSLVGCAVRVSERSKKAERARSIIPSHEEFITSKASFRFHIEINVHLTALTFTVCERKGVLVMHERLHLYGPTIQ
jgi:hypothetical protein